MPFGAVLADAEGNILAEAWFVKVKGLGLSKLQESSKPCWRNIWICY